MKVKVFNLIPCPFCGGEAKIDKTKHYTKKSGSSKWEHYVNFYVVFCANCFVKTDDTCTDLKEAVNTWNTRTVSSKKQHDLEPIPDIEPIFSPSS